MEGSPQSSSLSHHFPLSNEKMGMGAVITDDRIGVTSHTSAVIAYSYKLFFSAGRSRSSWNNYDHVFSFGVTAGVQRIRDNLMELGVEDEPEFAETITEIITL